MPEPFVILLHTGFGADHYDLMLSDGAALATWRLETRPAALDAGGLAPAEKLADHRRAYLNYEGPVGGGRGDVRRVDQGVYERLAVEDGLWRVRLDGETTRGDFELRRAGDGPRWSLHRLA